MNEKNRGFGLVEIMVGLMVGMISMIVIMQVFGVFEERKRTTTSGGDAQTTGALSMFLLEREIRVAGAGITEGEPQKYAPLTGCTAKIFDQTAPFLLPDPDSPGVSKVISAGQVGELRLAPAIITDGGTGGASDSLTVVYGSSVITAPYSIGIGGSYAPGGTTIAVEGASGINKYDMLVLAERGVRQSDNGNYIWPVDFCSVLQASDAPAAAAVPLATGRYNKAGGVVTTPTVYTENAKLYNLGVLSVVSYRVDSDGNLVADTSRFGNIANGTASPSPVANRIDSTPIMPNVVNMQIQYGVDSGNSKTNLASCKVAPTTGATSLSAKDADSVVDSWVDAQGTWANNGTTTPAALDINGTGGDLRRVRAVRIGLVLRSGLRASGRAGDLCGAAPYQTTPKIKINWTTGPDMEADLSGITDYDCYRYTAMQLTVPLRNTMWSSTMNPASSASCGDRS